MEAFDTDVGFYNRKLVCAINGANGNLCDLGCKASENVVKRGK